MYMQYVACMTFSEIYQHTHPHKNRKWLFVKIKFSAKGETPHGSIVSMDIKNNHTVREVILIWFCFRSGK